MPERLLPLPAVKVEPTRASLVLVDVVGSTRLAHALELGHYQALMAEFVQVMILSFEAAGGQVLQHQGDAVLALWPEGCERKAVFAALGAHERAARLSLAGYLGVQLQVRVGAAYGEVITGPVGGQMSAYGLPVNYSRRLCDAAAAGQTIVCQDLSGAAQGPWRVVKRPALSLQGFGPDCVGYELVVEEPVVARVAPLRADPGRRRPA